MATSIYGSGNHSSGKVQVAIDWWEVDVSTTANTSRIEAELWIKRDGYTSSGSLNMALKIGDVWGPTWTHNVSFSSQWVKVGQFGQTVTHNADGRKDVWLEAWGGIPSIGWTATNCSGWASLTTIARASKPTTSRDWQYAGQSFRINSNAASGAFGHNCMVRLGTREAWTPGNFGAGVDFTVPLSWLDQIVDAEWKSADIAVDTFAGDAGESAYIGTSWTSIKIWAPESVVPTMSGVSVVDANPLTAALGVWVQGQSVARVTCGTAAGVYGSSITKRRTALGDASAPWRDGETRDYALPAAGVTTAWANAVDSRGRGVTKTQDLTVLPYAQPLVTTLAVARCDAQGNTDPLGTYVRVVHAGQASSLKTGDTEKNTLNWRLLYRKRGGTTWTGAKTGTGLTWSDTAVIGGAMAATESYEIRLEAQDALATTIAGAQVATGRSLMVLGKSAVGFGRIPEAGREGIDVAGDIWLNDQKLSLPVLSEWVNVTSLVTPVAQPLQVRRWGPLALIRGNIGSRTWSKGWTKIATLPAGYQIAKDVAIDVVESAANIGCNAGLFASDQNLWVWCGADWAGSLVFGGTWIPEA